jgi:hypothetical protein
MGNRIKTFRAFGFAVGALLVCSVQAQHPYLDDANTRQPSRDGSLPGISQHGFPRTLAHELSVNTSAEAYSKYHFIDAHGSMFDKFETSMSCQRIPSGLPFTRENSSGARQEKRLRNWTIAIGFAGWFYLGAAKINMVMSWALRISMAGFCKFRLTGERYVGFSTQDM